MNSKRARNGLILVGLAVCGVAVSLVILSVHRQLAASGGQFTSFCNVNETVNCDVVLSSRYAYLFGVPVGLWAAASYVALGALALAVIVAKRFTTRLRLAQTLLLLAFWNAAFSLYMAWIAFYVLEAICVMCTGLYVINAFAAGVAWVTHAGVRAERDRRAAKLEQQNRAVVLTAAAAAVLVLVLAVWEGMARRGVGESVEEIARNNPDFYKWYTSQPVQSALSDVGNSRGGDAAVVTIVEFSDFQCGHCARAHEVLKEILPRYTNDVRLVFRHFPLDSSCNTALQNRLHSDACAAAIAAECAGEQGRFWEYHDRLFANQHDLGDENLVRFAREIGLDLNLFAACRSGPKAREQVMRDTREGAALGIESTPTFFFNGRAIRGSLDSDLFRHAIAIERAMRRS